MLISPVSNDEINFMGEKRKKSMREYETEKFPSRFLSLTIFLVFTDFARLTTDL